MSRVAAVVPTFNRKTLLVECIAALHAQTAPIDRIFVVDNASTDGTLKYLEEMGIAADPLVSIVRLPTNTGGAGAFFEGARMAHRQGYSWIWLMDDDSAPQPDCLARLLAAAEGTGAGAVCPLIVGDDSVVQAYHHKVITRLGFERPAQVRTDGPPTDVDANAFVGPLVAASSFDAVGYPEPGLFIWGDDTEFTWRLSKRRRLVVVPDAVIIHKDRRPHQSVHKAPLWRRCYFLRNWTWTRRRHGTALQTAASLYTAARSISTRGLSARERLTLLHAFLLGFAARAEARWRP